MVDAIFAIILFLLVCSSFVDALEQDLAIELPTTGRAVVAAGAAVRTPGCTAAPRVLVFMSGSGWVV